MATEFKVPELGENIESGDIVRVAVSAGESVSEGQAVVELETDKAVIEVPSTVSGKVAEVKVKQGQRVKVGDVLFTFDGANGTHNVVQPSPKAADTTAAQPTTATAERETPAPAATVPPKSEPAAKPAAPAGGGVIGEFRVPELGENIESGDVVRLAVAPGQAISEGQTVLELETDKAVIEVPSSVSGTVGEVKIKQGQKVKVGDVVFTVTGGQSASAPAQAAAPAPAAAAPAAPAEAAPQQQYGTGDDNHMAMSRQAYQSARSAEGKSEQQAFPPDQPRATEGEQIPQGVERHAGPEHRPPVPAAPIVRKLAREIGVDIYAVKGTGPGGRISEDDVKLYAKSVLSGMQVSAGAPAVAGAPGVARPAYKMPDFSKWGKVEKVPLRPVRRKTAEHLAEAWNMIPHVTNHDKADVTELEELRKRFAPKAELAGGKMTMTAIALKIVASALKTFPQFNASIDMATEEIIYKKYINVGVAVDTDRGLLVPVIRNVDQKNIIELAVELSTISKKSRDKKLTPDDMEGGTFTITNLGGIGGTAFTPIVNHPEVAILGMSRSRIEPVWVKDKFEPRNMLPVSLSYDHRIIDGADAARFLRWIVDALEQPFLLSVQG